MKYFKDQVLGGTRVDSQGEKIPKYVLDKFVLSCQGKKQPLNQDHDLMHKNAGYIENIRLVEDVNNAGEWSLIGNVFCETNDLKISLGGFSISYFEITEELSPSPELIIYLPYPHYNDQSVIDAISMGSDVNVGRWVKKGAEPASIALIGATTVIILKSVWEDLYKTYIAPKIYSYFSEKCEEFKSRNISTDLIQVVDYNGRNIQITFIPIRGAEKDCFSIDYLDSALKSVHAYLYSESKGDEISSIHLYFHDKTTGFKIHRVEFLDGNVEHHA
ncbi:MULTISPECIES: hypothetical protein [Aeromonas]|uniref:hypothetical protein n=1 Tax=Aeromonas TaxID=642 RepID=UPI000B28753C|nr:hypothetical protein [Aeromonas dhakensis]